MTLGGPRCSAEALARVEPMYATASLVSAWLLIEQPGAWGPDALTESKLPTEIAVELERNAGDVRILLIRNRARTGDPIYFKGYSGGRDVAPSLVSVPMDDPSDLLDVDMEALAQGDTGAGTVVDHPIYLVCTHGRHDICCADKGRPFYKAMSAIRPEWTWEASHIGGDRFAGNLLVLPRGDYFGRLEPEDAESLASDYEAHQLDLAHHRGRSIRPRLVQAAEHFIRNSEELSGFDDLAITSYRRNRDRAEVVFQGPDASFEVHVTSHRDPEPVYLTCRSERPGHGVIYKLDRVTRI